MSDVVYIKRRVKRWFPIEKKKSYDFDKGKDIYEYLILCHRDSAGSCWWYINRKLLKRIKAKLREAK